VFATLIQTIGPVGQVAQVWQGYKEAVPLPSLARRSEALLVVCDGPMVSQNSPRAKSSSARFPGNAAAPRYNITDLGTLGGYVGVSPT
jgi:hypothetical protein